MDITGTTPRRRVGEPTHERALTDAARAAAGQLLTSPNGTLVVLGEVEVGIGRPDLVFVRVDLDRLALRKAAGLRLGGYKEANALDALLAGRLRDVGYSRAWASRLERRLTSAGWLSAVETPPLILDSLVLEAKISDWGRALRQLGRVRWSAHHAALVVPEQLVARIPDLPLAMRNMGVIGVCDDGSVTWSRRGGPEPLPFYLDAWLGELVLRELEACGA